MMNDTPSHSRSVRLINLAKRLNAIAQTGLAYVQDQFDKERYEEVREIALEMLSTASGNDLADVTMSLPLERGHATPKVEVRGVVLREGKVLLVLERHNNKWSLPGGWAEVGLSPSMAVCAEIEQETGLDALVSRVLCVRDNSRSLNPSLHHVYKLFFRAEATGEPVQGTVETEAAEFFALDHLPQLSKSTGTEPELRAIVDTAINDGDTIFN